MQQGPKKSKKELQMASSKKASKADAVTARRHTGKPKASSAFDLKHATRPNKHPSTLVTTNKSAIVGRPSLAKGRAEALRRRTLLSEYRTAGRVGAFIDKRIRNREDPEAGAVERFVRARRVTSTRKAKAERFNLQKDGYDGEEVLLTHRGKELKDDEDFESEPDEVELPGESDGGVQEGNFGNYDEDEDGSGKRTKAEVMKEIIAKSKLHKLERQRARQENEELCDELNEDFDRIRDVFVSTQGLRDRALEKTATGDDYDALLKQMSMERRAQPTDRRRTPEELVVEQDKKERARIARMQHGLEEAEDGDGVAVAKADDQVATRIDQQMMGHVKQLMVGLEQAEAAYRLIYDACKESSQHIIALARCCRQLLPEVVGRGLVLLVQLIGRVFSTSDAHHIVATPAMLVSCRWLMTGEFSDPSETRLGLALCSLLIDQQSESRRWIPEVANFVSSVLLAFSAGHGTSAVSLWTRPLPVDAQVHGSSDLKSMIHGRGDMLAFARSLAEQIAALYDASTSKKHPHSFTIDEHVVVRPAESVRIAASDRLATLPELLRDLRRIDPDGASFIDAGALKGTRDRMRMLNSTPIALPALNPDIDDAYMPKRLRKRPHNNDGQSLPSQYAEQQKLRRAVKREHKSAKRELQKDAQFLARERAVARQQHNRVYQEQLRRTYGEIANETGEPKRRKVGGKGTKQ